MFASWKHVSGQVSSAPAILAMIREAVRRWGGESFSPDLSSFPYLEVWKFLDHFLHLWNGLGDASLSGWSNRFFVGFPVSSVARCFPELHADEGFHSMKLGLRLRRMISDACPSCGWEGGALHEALWAEDVLKAPDLTCSNMPCSTSSIEHLYLVWALTEFFVFESHPRRAGTMPSINVSASPALEVPPDVCLLFLDE